MESWKNLLRRIALAVLKVGVIGTVEPISIVRKDGTLHHNVLAEIDTTSDESYLDKDFAKELGLYSADQVLDRIERMIKGRKRLVEVIAVSFTLKSQQMSSQWLVFDRTDDKLLVTLGKNDCNGLLISVGTLEK